MKSLIIGSLLLSTSAAFAQNLDLNALKNVMNAKKATLEKVNAGMSKKTVTTAKESDCGYMVSSTESILKLEAERVIVLSKEKFQPQNSAACRALGYTTSTEQSILFYADRPTLNAEFEAFDGISNLIKGIGQNGNLINLTIAFEDENNTQSTRTLQYDLSKPIFKYASLNQGSDDKTVTLDMADIDLNSVDLKNVMFCDNNDGDNSECVQGDWSDILF